MTTELKDKMDHATELARDDLERQHGFIARLVSGRNKDRKLLRFQNPDIDVVLVRWYGREPLTLQRAMESTRPFRGATEPSPAPRHQASNSPCR